MARSPKNYNENIPLLSLCGDPVSPTTQLFLSLNQPNFNKEAINLVESLLPFVDWNQLLRQALYHRTIPLLYKNLNTLNLESIPFFVLDELSLKNTSNYYRSIKLTFELFKIIDILLSHNIRTVPYKGPVLSMLAYGDLSLRMFDDLDILISSEDYLKPKYILDSYGYIPFTSVALSPEKQNLFHKYFGEYAMSKSNITLDIHCHLLGNGNLTLKNKFSDVWDRLEYITIAGRNVPTLNSSDLLLYLCMNAFKDNWMSFKHVCDLAGFIHQNPDFDWDEIDRISYDLRIDRVFKLGILVTYNLLSIPIPPRILQKLRSDDHAVWLASRVSKRMISQIDENSNYQSPLDSLILKWVGLKYFKEKSIYLYGIFQRFMNLFSILNYKDTDTISLPPGFRFFYYLIRPFRIVCEYRKDVFNLLFK
jgi:Uncharacterised nucleotidyltransferase